MIDLSGFEYDGKGKLELSKIKTDVTGSYGSKSDAKEHLEANIAQMIEEQNKLYAQDKYAILIIFQAMDTAGKDGAIRHVMSGLNPQGTQVYSFKQPSATDLDHDYLWRVNACLPERGRIGVFNRSYYEEVLVAKVHNLIKDEKIPQRFVTADIWQDRYEQIRNYEKYLYYNGIIPIKLFLNISKKEQKKRLLDRIDDETKNWKFSLADLKERKYWDAYQECYEEAIQATSTQYAPWHIIPSDKKWYSRLIISEIIIKVLQSLKLEYPTVADDKLEALKECKKIILGE